MLDKSSIRRQMRARRQQLSRREQQQAARQFLRRGLRLLRDARSIALFIAFDGEPDLTPLRHALSSRLLVLPRINRQTQPKMHFVRCRQQGAFTKNRYGIAEPVNSHRMRLSDLDVILLPLTAFDRQGNRLGMGAGFYDRYLQSRQGRLLRHPRLIGVAYDWQEMAQLPSDPWDLPLHAILTNKEIIQVK